MAEYNMQELNLPGEDGKRILYPRMKLYGQVNLETITEKIAYASSFTRGDIIGLMQAITDEIAYQMGQGYSVKIDNLGVFTPALGLRQDRERETGEEGDTKRNAVSICLKDIHFKVDKELLYRTARHCHLKRSTDKFQRSSQVFSPQERLERAKEMLARVGLEERIQFKPTQLSGGQKQRVAIARAMVSQPRLLLADEPTGALDTRSGEQVMELFAQLHSEGVTIVMITHEPEIARHAQRIVTIRDGMLEQGGFGERRTEQEGDAS